LVLSYQKGAFFATQPSKPEEKNGNESEAILRICTLGVNEQIKWLMANFGEYYSLATLDTLQ
jgi:hypothetical protein